MSSTVTEERPLTFDDWNAFPEGGRDRIEILGGELFLTPPPWTRHQMAVGELLGSIHGHLEHCVRGMVYTYLGVRLGHYDVVIPDVLVVLAKNGSRLHHFGVDGPPDLMIEVVSPVTKRVDCIRKAATYATFGVPEYWIADPDDQTILAQTLVGKHYKPIVSEDGLVRSSAIAGLVIDPVAIFAVPEWMPAGS